MNPPAVTHPNTSTGTDASARQEQTKSANAGDLSASSLTGSSEVRLSRSRQTWTGAGSAAGFVLRYLPPMRRLLTDVLGSESDADRALAILISHLVKAGYSGHAKGRLRDFLILGLRSAAKARVTEIESKAKKAGESCRPRDLDLDSAKTESRRWLSYWREGLLQRTWRALEREQHRERTRSHQIESGEVDAGDADADADVVADEPINDLVHDVMRMVADHSGESSEVIAGRVAELAERSVSAAEVKRQLPIARSLFAQLLADEISLTLENADAKAIQAEISKLGLQKAFSGLQVKA
ncbi:MAG TPA: hypothetical protein DDX19_03890 [Rhodopirellula baltica]|uniref:Uncharacterized protein n=1 Tax=Rhodopirellula baltica (strain DSM 10527 / NCIMB 13988 / SH1) TaxID=243090 RepID=Q7UFV0_RHOBA|nr:hypothetical protein [Rhodopirellula baltica]CAD78580.1 hypothetical protein RB8325 [Rhodopirellula baltica SH 1]HBE61909.1 hypothetical protein [Rhodopirellula baltica]